ncbi:hypothetical protein VCHENC02_1774, partial [Vibrio harveyi]
MKLIHRYQASGGSKQ